MNYSNRLSRLVSRSQIRSRVVAWGSLLGLALPLAIGLDSAARATPLEELGHRAIAQAIDADARSTLMGTVRFVPPTDDDIGETQSGSSRGEGQCPGVFAIFPMVLSPSDGEYVSYAQLEQHRNTNPGELPKYEFPGQLIDARDSGQFDLFIYVAPAEPATTSRSVDVAVDLKIAERTYEPLAEQFVSLPTERSIVRLTLTADLARDELYKWSVGYCELSPTFPFESGNFGVSETIPPVSSPTTVLSTIERAESLAAGGHWLGALASLDDARLLAETPEERELVEANWHSLLASIGWDFDAYPIDGVPVLTVDELEAQLATDANSVAENMNDRRTP